MDIRCLNTELCPFWVLLHVGATPFTQSHFGGGAGAILLDNVRCSGHEQYLVDCSHSAFGVHNCDHSKDAGVGCISLG